jgi:AcrR family transcriptional regulator
MQATAQVLETNPYERVSTNRIAKAAGVSVGSLYQYFPDKEAIFAALLERHVERHFAALASHVLSLARTDLQATVRALVGGLFRSYATTPGLRLAMYLRTAQVGRLKDVVLQAYDKAVALIVLLLKSHRAELAVKNLERAAYLLAHAIDGMLIATVFHRPEYLTDEHFIEETARMALRYLGG